MGPGWSAAPGRGRAGDRSDVNLLTALLALQAASTAPMTESAILDAFRSVCGRVEAFHDMRANALRNGWVELNVAEEPRLQRMLGEGRATLPVGARTSDASFRPPAGPPDLFLVITRVETSAGWRSNCRFYHFGAASPLDADRLQRWMGRPPTRQEADGPANASFWEPGWSADMVIQISHIGAAHPMAIQRGFSGNVLIARAIGEF